MAESNKLRSALANVSVEDVSIDENGRVIINNPSVLAGLKEVGAGLVPSRAADDNYGCCKNGIACSSASPQDIADIRSRFVKGGT